MELRDYLRGLRRHWIAVVLMTAVGVATAFAWALLQTPVYEATANGLVQSSATAEQGGAIYGDSYAQSKVPTYLDMASWRVVAQGAADELGLKDSPSQLASRVTVENPTNTAILKFTAQASTPEAAAALAQAWITSLSKTIDQVQGGGGSAPISIYAAPSSVSGSLIFPDKRVALIVGGVLGLGIGIAFALVRTASDRRVRRADEVQERTQVPVVGTVPAATALAADHRLLDPTRTTDKSGGFALNESLRTLRTNLRFMDVDHPPRTIVVTSPLPGDGKSTVACNLAVTLAASGETTVLIDGDLRRPTVATTMGLPGNAGLSDVLAGRVSLPDVLQRTSSPNLYVLTAGSMPPNPSELLGSERMSHVLEELARDALVIIDAPPLLAVTDGAVLTHQADGAIMVVSVGKTTYDIVDKAIDTLHKAKGRVLGLVLNKMPLKGADAPTYSYAYRHEYVADAAPQTVMRTGSSVATALPKTQAFDLQPFDDEKIAVAPAAVHAADPVRAATPVAAPEVVSRDPRDLSDDAEDVTFEDLLSGASAGPPPSRSRQARRDARTTHTDA